MALGIAGTALGLALMLAGFRRTVYRTVERDQFVGVLVACCGVVLMGVSIAAVVRDRTG